MRGKVIWGIAGVVFLTSAVMFGSCEGRYRFGNAVEKEGVLLVPSGSDFAQLTDSLEAGGFLRNENVFGRQAKARGLTDSFKPGRYELRDGMTYARVINMLKSGSQVPVKITFNNIRTMDRLAGVVSRRLKMDSTVLLGYLESDSVAASYGYDRRTFIAMFIPDTYEVYWTITPAQFLDRMRRESDKFWEPRDSKPARKTLSRTEVMTLASIVYEETKLKGEMSRVAGVYMNRLERGMPLQADPTVKFALGDPTLRRILFRHLEIDSPYNTYRNAGLPPGPICMPSKHAIDGVLDYEDNDYLYFCANADMSGSHVFSKTLAEHNRNAQAYARALNRLGIR